MSRSLRRGALAATVAVVLPLAAGCAAGKDAETSRIQPDTANAQFGTLKIQNVQLVAGDEGQHLVALGGALFNEGTAPETITRVSVDGAGQAAGGPVTIPAGGALYLVDPPAGMDVDSPMGKTYVGPLVFPNAAEVAPGSFHTVTFAFGTAGETSLDVSVHSARSYYAQLKPTQSATPTPVTPPKATNSVAPSGPARSTSTSTPTSPSASTSTSPSTATSTSTSSGGPGASAGGNSSNAPG